jgi:TonB family protein
MFELAWGYMKTGALTAMGAMALTIAAPTVGAAADGSLARPSLVQRAKPSEVAEAYPKAASTQKISGDVELDCTADAAGRLTDCQVTEEQPAGMGFGDAAISLSAKERVKTMGDDGVSMVGRRFERSYSFLAPGDSNADWMKKPTGAQLVGVYPIAARFKRVDGKATISCKVDELGFLQRCKVDSETPAGLGFGPAALQLSPQFRMKPKIRGGRPVETEVTIPVLWSGFTDFEPRPGPVNSLVLDPPWTSTPSTAQVRAAWPVEANGVSSGQVALRCELNRTGGLTACQTLSEIPAGKGFGKAARSLTPAFKVAFSPDQTKSLSSYTVDVPFRFRSPIDSNSRKITAPKWTRTLTAEGMSLAYPQAAVKAGVYTGLGIVGCIVDVRGELTDCQVRREEPAGLDFGAAAIQAAKLIAMNPWSKEGEPLDGLPITLPIRFNWQRPDPAPQAPAPIPSAKPKP